MSSLTLSLRLWPNIDHWGWPAVFQSISLAVRKQQCKAACVCDSTGVLGCPDGYESALDWELLPSRSLVDCLHRHASILFPECLNCFHAMKTTNAVVTFEVTASPMIPIHPQRPWVHRKLFDITVEDGAMKLFIKEWMFGGMPVVTGSFKRSMYFSQQLGAC